jgi:flavin reductase (DIM6/NTAB) family NADH-FMN oxidoreductase RutF
VLASVPTPVTVVTALHRGRPHGTTVSAFSSLSLEPPLIVVSLDRGSELLSILHETGRFGVNVLHEGQAEHALSFARKGADKFAGVEWDGHGGLPRLPEATAWLACRAKELFPGGDHVLVTGLVEDAERSELPPLVYRERNFAALVDNPPGG